jgi:5'-methylthioadenosine phosphorylase
VYKIGMIGGSGFDDPDFVADMRILKKGTPFGPLSSDLVTGKIRGVDAVFLLRHGRGHRIMPSAVNFRANVWAMKDEGVTHLIATTACGSLRDEIHPGHLVFPDQFIDMTKRRKSTFYEGDQVVHIGMADPFCDRLRSALVASASALGVPHHSTGTVVTIEGPRFSTRAESRMLRLLGGDIVNMSTVPEVVLAREAGLCYATVAMSTDYDSWHESEEPVTWEMIVNTMNQNVENVKKVFFDVIGRLEEWDCQCAKAVETALV